MQGTRTESPAVETPQRISEPVFWSVWAFAWVALYLLVMAAPLEWAFQPINFEETADGTVAWGVLRHLPYSIWSYQYVPHAHGPWVYGLLLIPFHALFGPSLVWTKLIAGVFAAVGAVGWSLVVRRCWGTRAGRMMAVWMLIPPFHFARMTHMGWANHMESAALAAWVLGGALWCLDPQVRRWRPLLWGLFSGAATFFCFQVGLFFVAAMLVGLWRFRRIILPAAGYALAGAAVGLSPHVLYRLWSGNSFNWVSERLDVVSVIMRVFSLVTRGMTQVAAFEPRWINGFFATATLVAIAAVVLLNRRHHRSPGNLPLWMGRSLLTYFGVYLLAYGLTSFAPQSIGNVEPDYNFRYLLPLVPVFMAMIVSSSAQVRGRAAWLPVVVFMAFTVFTYARLASEQPAGTENGFAALRCLRGDRAGWYVETGFSAEVNRRFGGANDMKTRIETAAPLIEALPEPYRGQAWIAVARRLGAGIGNQALEASGAVPPRYRLDFLTGVGASLFLDSANVEEIAASVGLNELLARVTDPADRGALIRGFARALFEGHFAHFGVSALNREKEQIRWYCDGLSPDRDSPMIHPGEFCRLWASTHPDWNATDTLAFYREAGAVFGYGGVSYSFLKESLGDCVDDPDVCRALSEGYLDGEATILLESRRCISGDLPEERLENLRGELAKKGVRLEKSTGANLWNLEY